MLWCTPTGEGGAGELGAVAVDNLNELVGVRHDRPEPGAHVAVNVSPMDHYPRRYALHECVCWNAPEAARRAASGVRAGTYVPSTGSSHAAPTPLQPTTKLIRWQPANLYFEAHPIDYRSGELLTRAIAVLDDQTVAVLDSRITTPGSRIRTFTFPPQDP